VVKIFTHSVSSNYLTPWNSGSDTSKTGSGVIVEGNMILTAAHVVTDATYIEIKKHEDPKKYFAYVKWIAHDADLALLKVEEASFFKNTTIKKPGVTPKRHEDVVVYGYPEGGNKISITQGIISRIEVTEYTHSNVSLLTIQIDAAINSGNSGGPAFNKKGEIVGIAIQGLLDSNNIGYIAPVPVIQHFFDDIKDGKYDGFPDSGFYIQTMENKDLKAYYGMQNKTGVLVTEIIKDSSADGYIKNEDVLLEIDGVKVADDKTANVAGLGRISSGYLLKQHFVGDSVNIKVLRNKKELKLTLPLKGSTFSLNYNYNEKPNYYIFGGFVFMPLSVNYYFKMSNAPKSFGYEYIESIRTNSVLNQKEIVFISRLLEDKVNAGYSVSNAIVRQINNEDIDSFESLVEKIMNAKENVKITTAFNKVYVLNKEKAKKAETRILKRYSIENSSSLKKSNLQSDE